MNLFINDLVRRFSDISCWFRLGLASCLHPVGDVGGAFRKQSGSCERNFMIILLPLSVQTAAEAPIRWGGELGATAKEEISLRQVSEFSEGDYDEESLVIGWMDHVAGNSREA